MKQNKEIPNCECVSVSVNRVACSEEKGKLYFPEESPIDRLIETASSLYVLTKRVAYLRAFVEYLRCKFKKRNFGRAKWDTCDLNKALNKIVAVVQRRFYGQAVSLLKSDSPEDLIDAIERCTRRSSGQPKHWIRELRSLDRFRPCVDSDGLLRIEGRLSKSPELTDEMKHPLIILSRCAFTRLVVLKYHTDNLHVGVQHTLLSTRKKFWIVNGHAFVKHYLNQCGRCALEKAKP